MHEHSQPGRFSTNLPATKAHHIVNALTNRRLHPPETVVVIYSGSACCLSVVQCTACQYQHVMRCITTAPTTQGACEQPCSKHMPVRIPAPAQLPTLLGTCQPPPQAVTQRGQIVDLCSQSLQPVQTGMAFISLLKGDVCNLRCHPHPLTKKAARVKSL